MNFLDLIEDVLLHIFDLLDPHSLYSIRCLEVEKLTCLVDLSMKKRIDTVLMTGRDCFSHAEQGNTIESDGERLRIHSNWVGGQFLLEFIVDQSPLRFT